jgi:hypothetical protein
MQGLVLPGDECKVVRGFSAVNLKARLRGLRGVGFDGGDGTGGTPAEEVEKLIVP